MRFLCTIAVLSCLIAKCQEFGSNWEVCFALIIAFVIDGYDLALLQWCLVLLYGVLLCCYLVSWIQKLL